MYFVRNCKIAVERILLVGIARECFDTEESVRQLRFKAVLVVVVYDFYTAARLINKFINKFIYNYSPSNEKPQGTVLVLLM